MRARASTGLATLFRREVRRFLRRPRNTFLPPFVTNVLYLVVFGVILGERLSAVAGGFPYVTFVLPGLIVLGAVSNAFENASFSIFHGRWNEYIHEVLTSPMSYSELAVAYVSASMVRGLLVGGIVAAVGFGFTLLSPGYDVIPVAHPLYLLASMVAITALFAAFGIVGGLWARDFDYLTVLTQFIIRPLVFFGGVFYSLDALPGVWRTVSLLNPMVYMVDAVRYGFLDYAELDPAVSLSVLLASAAALVALDAALIRRGYGLVE